MTSSTTKTRRRPARAAAPKTPTGADAPARHARERQLFDALREGVADSVSATAVCEALRRAGLRRDDPRLGDLCAQLQQLEADGALDFDAFRRVIRPALLLVERALQGRLVVPDFGSFGEQLDTLLDRARRKQGGAVASYIPQLARVDPDQLGFAVCTVDGQRHEGGDSRTRFTVQSCCKPIGYALALEEHGLEKVHAHIGREPSGQSFNELALNRHGRPHNPMINSGAIMSSALIRPDLTPAERFDHVVDTWRRLGGDAKPGFDNATYLSERRTADRNFAIGYFMRENGAFPEGIDLHDVLEFYFQCCSLEMTAENLSVVAATLANGGVCPLTGERVFAPATVQSCLALMDSCGMYDFSGEWAFTIGLPAKSGVCGAIWVVIPNVLGLCVWSPPLDENGNSVRGIEFCRGLVETFSFHKYDSLVGLPGEKLDPRRSAGGLRSSLLVDLCWAASEGDLDGIRRLVACGVALGDADYDGRTALHLAASEGHADVVEFFLRQGVNPDPVDRWGATPLDDARREGHAPVAELLLAHGGSPGTP